MYNDGPIQSTTVTITLLLLLLYSLLYSYIARIILYTRGAALPILREQILPLQHSDNRSSATATTVVAQLTSVVPRSKVVRRGRVGAYCFVGILP